jgi:hypothetical protein
MLLYFMHFHWFVTNISLLMVLATDDICVGLGLTGECVGDII